MSPLATGKDWRQTRGMQTLHWGILATGTIARTFADALMRTDSGRLAAVASRTLDGAREFAAHYADVTAHGDYQALLDDPTVHAVYIAAPHPAHAEWVLKAVRAGKAVLCEKPLGINHAEVMAMVDAAEQARVFLMEAFMYRCHPQTERLVALIRDGAIGEVRHLEARFGYHASFDPHSRLFANDLGGGGILDVGCYPVSAARLILDAEPISVTAHGHLGRTGVDEWSAALLGFDDGVSAQVATGVSVRLDNSFTVYGSTGRIRVDNPWLCADAEGRWEFQLLRHGREPEVISGRSDPLYVIEADHVARCLADGRLESPCMTWRDSLGNAQVLDAWRRAIGLEYRLEQPAGHRGPLSGRPPRPAADAPMGHGRIRGLDKPVARLVMGCDNQPGMSHAAVMWDHYVECGGNAFDTAYVYGRGRMEALLGHWQRSRGLRDELVIIGKGAHTPDNFPNAIAPQLTESLDRLQSDHVDVYFLHRDNVDVPVGEFVDALNDEVRRGRIRVFGGSNWTLPRLAAANAYAAERGLQGFAALSNHLSLARMVTPIWPGVETAANTDYRRYLRETGTALMPWSSQARGFFTPWADAVIAEVARENPAITTMQPTAAELKRVWLADDNLGRRARAAELAERHGVDMINIALAWVLGQPFPCFPLIGPRTLSETRSCLRALTVTLSPDDLAWLEAGASAVSD
jgi:predicted dehydrogenase/aryl-alcohol dehydrogenase-like predicted oxidoreductase